MVIERQAQPQFGQHFGGRAIARVAASGNSRARRTGLRDSGYVYLKATRAEQPRRWAFA